MMPSIKEQLSKKIEKIEQTDKTQKEIIILQEGQNDAIHKGTAFEED